jgi:hypothetical protein
VEIKSGKTMAQSYFDNLKSWQQLTGYQEGYVVYGGDASMKTSQGMLVSWKQLEEINA